jgi:hypothetical protein
LNSGPYALYKLWLVKHTRYQLRHKSQYVIFFDRSSIEACNTDNDALIMKLLIWVPSSKLELIVDSHDWSSAGADELSKH